MDKEKIINGLNCCNKDNCDNCPYLVEGNRLCVDILIEDAARILREYEYRQQDMRNCINNVRNAILRGELAVFGTEDGI